MSVFAFSDYKDFLRARVSAMPQKGRGQLKKLARHLKVHASFLTQVTRGGTHLSPQQAHGTGEYLGLSGPELEYFVGLVNYQRATQADYRRFLAAGLRKVAEQAQEERGGTPPEHQELSARDLSLFFSSWHYSAVYAALGIRACQTIDGLASRLGIPLQELGRILEFLVVTGLAREDSGKYTHGVRRLHVPADSPFSLRHHVNWRIQAIESTPAAQGPGNFRFTFPFSIGDSDCKEFTEKLQKLIASLEETLATTRPEKVACLTIDLMDVTKSR